MQLPQSARALAAVILALSLTAPVTTARAQLLPGQEVRVITAEGAGFENLEELVEYLKSALQDKILYVYVPPDPPPPVMLPDLVADRMRISVFSAGAGVRFNVRINNDGNVDAGPFRVTVNFKVFAAGDLHGTPLETGSFEWREQGLDHGVTVNIPGMDYYFMSNPNGVDVWAEALVDTDVTTGGRVVESNEMNNYVDDWCHAEGTVNPMSQHPNLC